MDKIESHKIIILGTNSSSTKILYNSLKNDYSVIKVIVEKKENPFLFLKRRIKKIGFLRVFDQFIFMLVANKILSYTSRKRRSEILKLYNLSINPIEENKIIPVYSVNDKSTIDIINSISPNLIILSGTRILSKLFLSSVSCQVLNIHAGITPYYRGVHGAYWAYLNKQSELAGVTLHRVDNGIDTGKIISQKSILVEENDDFNTYPFLQLQCGIELLKVYLSKPSDGPIIESSNKSKLWYHPGFFKYFYHRLVHGIK